MELLLLKQNLWKKVITGTGQNLTISNAAELGARDDANDLTRASIRLLVDDNQLVPIRNKITAKEAWIAL